MMTYLGTDLISQEGYFEALTTADPELKTFILETGDDIIAFYEKTKSPKFHYPCLVLFMPFIDIDDNAYGLIEALQETSFAVLCKPASATSDARNEAMKQAQLMAFRVIGKIRKDAREGRFRLPEQRKWKLRPMTNVGPDNAWGTLVDLKYITNANAQVGIPE